MRSVTIERIVLDGVDFPPRRAEWLKERIAGELRSLIEAKAPGLESRSAERLRAPDLAAGVSLPKAIAQAVYRALEGGK